MPRRKKPEEGVEKKRLYALAYGLPVALALFVYLYFPTQLTAWNTYYERQVDSSLGIDSVAPYDDLSYMGRGMTFLPGYMAFKSFFLKLAGLSNTPLPSLLLVLLLNLCFSTCFLLFSEKLSLSSRQSTALFLFLVSTSMIPFWVSSPYPHMLAYAMLLGLLAYSLPSIGNKNMLLLVAALSSATLVHASTFFAYPLIFLALCGENWRGELKNLSRVLAASAFLVVLLYSNTLFSYGLPYEIVSDRWGYLIDALLPGVWSDFVFFIPFCLLAVHRAFSDPGQKNLAYVLLAGSFFYVFYAYRINVYLAIPLGVLVVRVFSKDFERKSFRRVFYSAAALTLLFHVNSFGGSIEWQCHEGFLQQPCLSTYGFLAENTPRDTVIGSDPFYGHSLAYFAERKVLADLYVEYADLEKYLAADMLFWKGDTTALDEYGVDVVLLDNATRAEKLSDVSTLRVDPVTNQVFLGEGLDKVYDNGVFQAYFFLE